MLAALVDAGASNGVAAPRQASQTPPPPPTVSDEVLDVLAQYDGLRAALARDGATNFYVAVTAERTAVSQTLTIQGTATKKADRVAIGGKYPDTWSRPDENTILVTNPPDEVFTGQPAIELWAGHRLVGAARFINVKSSTL